MAGLSIRKMAFFAYPPEKVYFSDYMIVAPEVGGILR